MPAKGVLVAVTADVVVAGGGVIGTAIAWRAAAAGLDVVLADPAAGDAASLVAAGMLAPVSEALFGEGALLRVNLLALARFPPFAAELEQVTGHRVGLRREGTLAVAYDAGDYAALMRLTAFRRSAGLDAEELDGRACRKLESFLTPDVHGGVLFPGDWSVDNRRYAAALREAAAGAGVRTVRDRVTAVLTGGRTAGRAASRWRKAARSAAPRSSSPPGAGRARWTACPRGCGPRSGRSRASCFGCGTRTACPPSSPTPSGPRCAAWTSTWCRGPTAR
jgi:glycine/D-amino acid oxidase-like deaminating enzyme